MTTIDTALAYRISAATGAIDHLMDGNQTLNQELIDAHKARKDEAQAIRDRIEKVRADFDPADPYRAAAKEQANDDLEVDDDAVVSPGDDPGAWVQAWIWIRNDEAGISEDDEDVCRTCGAEYEDGGDGFDGECPDCADKTDQKLNPENYVDEPFDDGYPANWTKDDG
ncbi:hypothetical protein HJA82_29510 [Rhizobium bangladeshense]|uniref:hypothetical protein n=1 Tax=Rhizobium bangladeshense TaxID=1138189 RepID=UPI001C83C038|nr:hypothetical protein [Rhizobium bangladeshense]MBX4911454.1 hypothetical protein [Rhizobium bangladeshense]